MAAPTRGALQFWGCSAGDVRAGAAAALGLCWHVSGPVVAAAVFFAEDALARAHFVHGVDGPDRAGDQ